MTSNLKKAARFALKRLIPSAPRPAAAEPIGEGTPLAWAGPVAGPGQ
jgi:hypothetical protein